MCSIYKSGLCIAQGPSASLVLPVLACVCAYVCVCVVCVCIYAVSVCVYMCNHIQLVRKMKYPLGM